MNSPIYRGRLAPSPTGFLHVGHARTFWIAHQRARAAGGVLVLRIEDLDGSRCRPEFRDAIAEDLAWLGISWDEGPDQPGPHAPYTQSQRFEVYEDALKKLIQTGHVYPCRCSRRDIQQAVNAPQAGDDETIYPGTCRPPGEKSGNLNSRDVQSLLQTRGQITWRFRVPNGEVLTFVDGAKGHQTATAGVDFGDFVVWRRENLPAYQLAVVADDLAMRITEVVRGEDLLTSTFRQILLYRALGCEPPLFYHTPLVNDPATGQRLAKRHKALSLRELRASGTAASALTSEWIS